MHIEHSTYGECQLYEHSKLLTLTVVYESKTLRLWTLNRRAVSLSEHALFHRLDFYKYNENAAEVS